MIEQGQMVRAESHPFTVAYQTAIGSPSIGFILQACDGMRAKLDAGRVPRDSVARARIVLSAWTAAAIVRLTRQGLGQDEAAALATGGGKP